MTPSYCKRLRTLYKFGGKYVYANSELSPKNYHICNRMANQLTTSAKRVTSLMLFSMALFSCAPMYKIFISNEKELMIPVVLPFIDPNTEDGFNCNLANQTICCSLGIFVLVGTELLLCVIKNNISAAAAVI